MSPTVYVETTILSYLTAHPSGDLVIAAHQRVTAEWWQLARARYRLVASAVVLQEVSAGDPVLAERRRALLAELPLLEISPEVRALAEQLLIGGLLPPRAHADALHVAAAAVGGVDYLVTWNLWHLAGAFVRRRIERALRAQGFDPPALCTPEELLEDNR